MKGLFSLLLNPFTLALWMTLLIEFLFPVRIDKYGANLIESGKYLNNSRIQYIDLNGDGSSEKIDIFHNGFGTASFTVWNSNGVLGQWNLKGNYDFAQSTGIVNTGDYNKNSIKEIYIFTLVHDSLILHILTDYLSKTQEKKSRFITRVGINNGNMDPYIIPAEMEDLNHDGTEEFIFGVGTGHSLSPRRVFAYDFLSDTLSLSPESNYFLIDILQGDLNGDGIKEILPNGYAASNMNDRNVPFTDTSAWLMVLNNKLEFVFEPVQFPGPFSKFQPAVIMHKNRPVIIGLYHPPENRGSKAMLMEFDNEGEIIRQQAVPVNTTDLKVIRSPMAEDKILLDIMNEGYWLYNTSFEPEKFVSAFAGEKTLLLDIDSDGEEEILSEHRIRRQLIIFRYDLKYPVSLPLEGTDEKSIVYSVKKEQGRTSKLYIQFGNSYQLYDYKLNPKYKYRFLYYAAIYVSILLFILLIRKIQNDQIKRKQLNEKMIADLQLQIIRNQLDPHFVMNAINSIISGISEKNKDEAREQLLHFAKLHRSLLMSADMLQRSLGDELEFVENFLALEKLRFPDKFEYEINIVPEVDQEVRVPKMILQIHTENALKHGILPMNKKGKLQICIKNSDPGLQIEITDNGVGRENSAKIKRQSTGKGLKVMENYTELFNKYHPGTISSTIEDVYDEYGEPSGTKVTIIVSGS